MIENKQEWGRFFKVFKKSVALIVICAFLIPLVACQKTSTSENQISYHSGRVDAQIGQKDLSSNKTDVKSIKVDEYTFRSIIGWLSNDELLLNEFLNGKSVLSSYNIFTGKKKELLSEENQIITAELSPSKEYLLLHTSPTNYEAQLTIYSIKTFEKIYETMLESFEISYDWNQFDESKLIVTSFYEDWSFKNFILNLEEQSMNSINLPNPFAIWINENDLAFLDWDTDSPDITAPLKVYKNGKIEMEIPGQEFYHIFSLDEKFGLIGISEHDQNKSEYLILDRDFNEIGSFQIPHLTSFSGWEVALSDFVSSKDELFLIEPQFSSSTTDYLGDFSLVKKDLKNGEEEVIISKINNAPITCSPDGAFCLSGFQNENIITIKNQTIKPFLIFKGQDE